MLGLWKTSNVNGSHGQSNALGSWLQARLHTCWYLVREAYSMQAAQHVKLWSTDVDNPMTFFWSPPPTEPLFVIFVAINRRNMLKPQNLGFIFWDKFTTTEKGVMNHHRWVAFSNLARDPTQSKLVKLPHVKLAVWGSFAVELQPFFRNTLPRSARGRWLGPPVRVSAVHGEWLCHVRNPYKLGRVISSVYKQI